MLFNSFQFAVFYLAFFAVFFSIRDRVSQLWLIVFASLCFYGAWNPVHVPVLLAVCALCFAAQSGWLARGVSVALMLALLFVFKYFNFFVSQLTSMGIEAGPLAGVTILLPIGISFYVFHGISFVVDQGRGKVGRASLAELTSYIGFFPQLVAGPIVRARTFLPQLAAVRMFNPRMFRSGLLLFAMGMFKKVVIADNVGSFVDAVYDAAGATTAANHVLAFYLYAVQIYYDFCGYSDMAIGIARTLGYRFPPNFNRPYLSASITEFWRRWHISLSSWLRDYLYISLGGNRRGTARTYLNLALVMLLGGLWHGANWTFVVWGAMHGLLLAAERAAGHDPRSRWSRRLGILVTFHLVCVSWVFFRSPNFAVASAFFSGLTDLSSLTTLTTKFTAMKCLALLCVFFVIERFAGSPRIFIRLRSNRLLVAAGVGYALLFFLLGNFSTHPFIYFQF